MADKPLEDVWVTRDLPVLTEVTRRIDAGERPVMTDAISEATGLDSHQVELAGLALERRGFVRTGASAETWVDQFDDVAGAAYLVTGLHPDGDDALSRLVSVLTQAAERSSDPEERSRLRRAADGLVNLPSAVATGVMTAYVTGMLPGH